MGVGQHMGEKQVILLTAQVEVLLTQEIRLLPIVGRTAVEELDPVQHGSIKNVSF